MPVATPVFHIDTQTPVAQVTADVLLIGVFHQKDAAEKGFTACCPLVEGLDSQLKGQLLSQALEEQFDGSKGKVLSVRSHGAIALKRVVLVGLGDKAKYSPAKMETAMQAATAHAIALKGSTSLAVAFPCDAAEDAVQSLYALTDGIIQATYRSLEAKKPVPDLKTVHLLLADASGISAEVLSKALPVAQAMAQARSDAKDLVNMPSNLKTTDVMVTAAKALASLPHVTVAVVDDVEWIKKEMPAFFAVAQGSVASDPPKFITVKYAPPAAKKTLAYVGKTVIFDTGGYQVKPGNSMVTMKGDMTGGAMVLATLKALATLQVPIALNVYLAATPNKIDSHAFIPDSIIGSTCGKTIEVRHTDAEGRLTLIDAVTKAAEDKPDEMLTIATLTGAAKMAVGICVAMMSNNTALGDRVKAAATYLDEPFQVLDMFESDYEDIKSKLDGADIRNTNAGEGRGSQTAGAFVMMGAPEGMPVVHLDIAGADMTKDEKATGIAQKTLILHALRTAEAG
jgi:leucyl aminopeptidase